MTLSSLQAQAPRVTPQARTYWGCWPEAQCGPDFVDGDDGHGAPSSALHRFTDYVATELSFDFGGFLWVGDPYQGIRSRMFRQFLGERADLPKARCKDLHERVRSIGS